MVAVNVEYVLGKPQLEHAENVQDEHRAVHVGKLVAFLAMHQVSQENQARIAIFKCGQSSAFCQYTQDIVDPRVHIAQQDDLLAAGHLNDPTGQAVLVQLSIGLLGHEGIDVFDDIQRLIVGVRFQWMPDNVAKPLQVFTPHLPDRAAIGNLLNARRAFNVERLQGQLALLVADPQVAVCS